MHHRHYFVKKHGKHIENDRKPSIGTFKMKQIIRPIATLNFFAFCSSALAEDLDYDAWSKTLVKTTAGVVLAQNQSTTPLASTRLRLRGSIIGIPLPGLEHAVPFWFDGWSFLRTNAFGEWDYQDRNLQAYNIDTDLLSSHFFGGDSSIMDLRGAIGYIQLSHDELMEEQYDFSAKLIDCELRHNYRFIAGWGFNVLGYQQRKYTDDTILKGIDIIGGRLEYGKSWFDLFIPIELTMSIDGDIGFAEGLIVDNLIDTRLSFHLPIFGGLFAKDRPKTRLQFVATHNLHYNSARDNTTQGVFRFVGQFSLQYPIDY